MTPDPPSTTPDLTAYREAVAMSTPALITELTAELGLKLVAYLGHVTQTRAVRQWAKGTHAIPTATDIDRLRVAYQTARLIRLRESREVAQAWFQGLNPLLGDLSPARLLREGDIEVDGPRVLAAARQFAAVG